ncbi:MAG: hypothetical protein AABZ47_02070 [Planctomycetota bacterium]
MIRRRACGGGLRFLLIACSIAQIGCRVHLGANHLFLVTRANSGIDIDTLPAVVEASVFSRFDGVHAPTFERAQTIPVVTIFQRGMDGSWPITGALFASGPAAIAVATLSGNATVPPSREKFDQFLEEIEQISDIELSEPPKFWNKGKQLFKPGEAPPFWFGVSESVGMEFEFYGPSVPPLPQSFHAGFRRKEFLVTPLSLSEDKGRELPYVVHTPSNLAIVNMSASVAGSGHCKCRRRVQFFATGKAALRLAARPDVWKLFNQNFVDAADESGKVPSNKPESGDQAQPGKPAVP